ncbi:hypothetical protein DFR51_2997 [Sphingosinicella microcystinivorans]|uniref:Uncharacterized protein n=1 Tax=Sphingosinicella microcystinivorans TaxID=335406 RepID=A0ABX9SVJ3_SPHMI|nr:hypothetical protein DFR51_2997 [Sphingosinicella microcystinivorans]
MMIATVSLMNVRRQYLLGERASGNVLKAGYGEAS